MSDETTVVTQPDSFGRHWVYVTDAQVRSHAKGRFSLAIWVICLWFVAVGGFEIVSGSSASLPRMVFGLVLVFDRRWPRFCAIGWPIWRRYLCR